MVEKKPMDARSQLFFSNSFIARESTRGVSGGASASTSASSPPVAASSDWAYAAGARSSEASSRVRDSLSIAAPYFFPR